MITYNTFIQRFKDFADNHYFIRSFSHGAPEDVDLDKQNEYPLMHVIYTGAGYEDTTKTLSFEVYIFDLPSHYENKQDRQKEVVSDAEQCAEDVIADIVNGGNIFLHSEDYTIASARVSPLLEESSNVLAGVLLEVDVQIPYDRDACNAPIDGVSPEGGEIVYARRGVLRVRTVDSATDVQSVRTIVVPNGTLTDDGGGQVTLNISGAGDIALDDLTDVNLGEALDREALVYDEASGDWISGGPAKVDFPVYNATASTIAIGKVVAFAGSAQGDRPTISLFSASSASDVRTVIGVTMESIAAGQPGHVRSYGTIYGLNTLAYPVGTILYASTTAGELTSTAPTAPNHRIAIGVVTRQHVNTGRVFVRTHTPGYRIGDLSDVSNAAPTSNMVLTWDGTKWAPALPTGGYIPPGSPPPGGYTPAIFYRASDGTLAVDEDLQWVGSTNTLTTVNVTGSGIVKGTNTYGARFATEAATNRALANATGVTVERYFTCTAEGNGESFNIQSNTPSAGNKIVRKIWYKNEAFEATDVNTWTLVHTFADNATYASTATQWAATLEAQTYGKPPFTLAISWQDISAFTGLLDDYPGAAAAYSVRLLDKDYAGSCIRVRRASDNKEEDIGFTLAGDLDTSALASFCTGTNGFVKTWYDQSGNARNATQTTTANQPKIYDSSTGVVLLNGNAAIEFDGTDDAFEYTTLSSTTTKFVVQKTSDTTAVLFSSATVNTRWNFILQSGSSSTDTTDWISTTGAYGYKNGTLVATQGTTTRNQLYISIANNAQNLTSWVNLNTATADTYYIGRYFDPGYQYSGVIQEIILYNTDQSANRAAIETNINSYFSIY